MLKPSCSRDFQSCHVLNREAMVKDEWIRHIHGLETTLASFKEGRRLLVVFVSLFLKCVGIVQEGK